MSSRFEVTLVCDQCGKEFVCHHRKRLENKNHFCSRKCQSEYTKGNNPNRMPCAVCGKLIYRSPSSVQKSRTKQLCCSYQCMGVLRKSVYLGEDNPNYGNRGDKNPIWKSDERLNSYGYILQRAPDHPFANGDGFVFQHRLVAEKYFLNDENSIEIDGNRYLKKEFDVHHIDHNKANNDPSNLMVVTRKEHARIHNIDKHNKELAS